MGCRYIYSIYDAKSGALVAKGDAAKLVGLGLFRDAGVLSTSYHKNRECKRPRKYRIEREKVVKTFVMTTPQKALRSMQQPRAAFLQLPGRLWAWPQAQQKTWLWRV